MVLKASAMVLLRRLGEIWIVESAAQCDFVFRAKKQAVKSGETIMQND